MMTVPSPLADTLASIRRMIDAVAISEKLSCSVRHVHRMADAGAMPWGCKLGALRRWDEAEIDAWIAAGCPAVRRAGHAG
jgi:predicted DNA-binding transcriptional regulator AlpA